MDSPQRMFSPQSTFEAHAYVFLPIEVCCETPVASHHEPVGLDVSIARASAMAPAALTWPVPWLNASVWRSGMAVNSTIAFMRFGVIPLCLLKALSLCACSTSAMTPVETAAVMLVPFDVNRRSPFL